MVDYHNSRVQEVAVATGTQWGQSMTANDIYTVAGSASGSYGSSGDGGAATSALLYAPTSILIDPAGDIYIADGDNNRVQEVPATTSTQWGQAMTTDDMYTIAGGSLACADGVFAPTSACFDYPTSLAMSPSGNIYVADDYDNTVRELAGGHPSTYAYDLYGDLTSSTDPDGDTSSATYDDLGNELSSTSARGNTTSYSYDADNELTEVSLPGSVTESYTYDGDGNMLTYVDGRGKTTTYTYDPLDRLASAEDPDSHTTTYTYDADGNLSTLTDPATNETRYTYDHADQLTGVAQPDSSTLSYSYDPDGNEASYTNAAGQTTSYTYDYLDQLTEVTDPLSRSTSYTYDADGNQATTTQPGSEVTTSTYDADDELTGASYSDGATHSLAYAYDSDGGLVSMTDASGASTYAYDPAGRLVGYEDGAGAAVGYAYDPDGNLAALAYPNGQVLTESYDSSDRLSSLTDWLGATTSFSYDNGSDLTAIGYPNGVVSADSYDNAGELSSLSYTKGATTLVSFSYTDDADADLSAETDTGTPRAGTTGYSYSSLGQLSSAGTASYGYDSANNLTTGPGGATQAFDADGELCWSGTGTGSCSSPPTGATAYTYSSRGDRTATTPASGPASTYSWDQANELTGVAKGTSSASFSYDGQGLRQSETAGSATTQFTWGSEGSLPVLLSDGANSYIYGPEGTPIEQVSSAGTPTYLLSDRLGSTRALTNPAGTVTASFSYDAWGNLTGSTGSATTAFMYAGQYYDASTGLYYMQARYYDPATGQFLSVDPALAETQSPYAYVGDDPLNGVDPSGLCWICHLIARGADIVYHAEVDTLKAAANFATGAYNETQTMFPTADRFEVPPPFCGPGFGAAYYGGYVAAGLGTLALGLLGGEAEVAAEGAESSEAVTRGLSDLGGVIEETGTNSVGGRIFTSTGSIAQKDFAGIVNSALMRGDDVSILTGAHGLPNGTLVPDPTLLADDEAAFGDLPGVHIYDVASMSPAEIRAVLNGPGTIIGAFCDSDACLARYGR